MCLPWFCYRWYRRCQILAILVYRYFSPWDTFFLHPIVFEIWGLVMDSQMIAEQVVSEQLDLEMGDSGDENDSSLLEDDSPAFEMIASDNLWQFAALAGAKRRGPAAEADAEVGAAAPRAGGVAVRYGPYLGTIHISTL